MKNSALVLFLVLSCTFFPLAHADGPRLMSVEHLSGQASHFKVKVQDQRPLNGVYSGWCAQWAKLIEDGKIYVAPFYSSYSSNLPEGTVGHPENLDEVNWIINQRFVGKMSPGGFGAYTSGDVQLAIWTLLDDHFEASTVGPFSQDRVDEIVARAMGEGSGFYPTCRQLVGILLLPSDPQTGTRVQTTIVEVPRRKFPKCVIPDSDRGL